MIHRVDSTVMVSLGKLRRRLTPQALGAAFGFALLGALLTLTFAPFNYYLLAPLLTLPVFLTRFYSTPRRAAWHAFFFGFGLFVSGTYWIYVSVHVFGQAPLWIAMFLMFGLVLIMAAYCAGIGWTIARLCARPAVAAGACRSRRLGAG